MQLTTHKLLALAAISLTLAGPALRADTYADNIGQTLASSTSIDDQAWTAAQFTTNAAAASYTLDSLTLRFSATVSPGSPFTLDIYTDAAGDPGTSLGTLSGSAPTGVGNFTYTASGISLNANSSYWIVAQVTGVSDYSWAATDSATVTGGWSIATQWKASSNSGASWSTAGIAGHRQQMTIVASPVPEPSTYAVLLGASALGLALWRRRRTR